MDYKVMKEEVVVTVCIPVYNVEQYILDAINSVASQRFNGTEILLIPDKCTDNSLQVIQSYIKCHSELNIRLLDEPQINQGISVIRNKAIDNAKGKYLVFLDSDDVMLPNSLASLVSEIEKSNTEVSIGNYHKVSIAGQILYSSNYRQCVLEGNDKILNYLFNKSNSCNCHFASWAKIYNLQFLKDNKIRCIETVLFDDWVFTLRLFFKVNKISFTEKSVYRYTVQRPGSTMSTKRSKNSSILINSWMSLLEFYEAELNGAIAGRRTQAIPFICDRLCRILEQLTDLGIDRKIVFNRFKLFINMPFNVVNLLNYRKLCLHCV